MKATGPAGIPELPVGARLLGADELAHRVVTGDHPESAQGSVRLDGTLVELVRGGLVLAVELADGRLAFTRTTPPVTG